MPGDQNFQYLFKNFLPDLDPKTQKKIVEGRHNFQGKVGRLVSERYKHGSEFLSFVHGSMEKIAEHPGEHTLRDLSEDAFDGMEAGFHIFSGKELPQTFKVGMEHLRTIEDLGFDAHENWTEGNFQALQRILQSAPVCPEYWLGIDRKQLSLSRPNEGVVATLVFRGFLYRLAVMEAIWVSMMRDNGKSMIAHCLMAGPERHLKQKKPLQRFFLSQFSSVFGGTLSISKIAENIGGYSKPASSQESHKRDFRRKLNAGHHFKVKDAHDILRNVLIPAAQERNLEFPEDTYWLTFFAARGFQKVCAAYEKEKASDPCWHAVLPEGLETLFCFYKKAYSHATQVVPVGETKTTFSG